MGHMADRCRTDMESVLFFVSLRTLAANTIEMYLQQSYTIEGRALLHSIFPQIHLLLRSARFCSIVPPAAQSYWDISRQYFAVQLGLGISSVNIIHIKQNKCLCKNYDGG